MSGPTAEDHSRLDELAAGYALYALDPPDEQYFLAHLPGCSRCQDAIDDYRAVTAAMAASLPDTGLGEPSGRLRDRIMTAASEQPARPDDDQGPAAEVSDLASRRHRRRLRAVIAGTAAAAVLAAGGTIWAQVSSSGSGSAPPLASCLQMRACREVVLIAAGSQATAARVIVSGRTAWLVPSGLPADHPSRQIYVLWQITGRHVPVAVGSFDVGVRRGQAIRIGALAVPYDGTRAFAVSLERGRAIPATPSRPVALGQVSS
jgi:hypothetical protein